MATGWAVGSSVVLAGALAMGGATSSGLVFALLVVAGACWAFAVARAAYGSKGALVALLANAIAAAAVAVGLLLTGAEILAPALVSLAVIPTAVGIVSEIRSRRGPMQAGTAFALAAPGALWAVLAVLSHAAPA